MNFYEKQLKRMFPDFDTQSGDTIFAGKSMLSIISDDLRAKVEFMTGRVAGQYEGLRLSIINKNEGVIDSQSFMFYEIIGMKGPEKDRKPHVWDDNGQASWFVYEPTDAELESIGSKVEEYVWLYADHDLGIQM
ncbi:MAG: hypothetical protein J6C58_01015 [Bacteroidaceae bacterium]|nr:hypothetical protein [Bacteroidaceae bacterium]